MKPSESLHRPDMKDVGFDVSSEQPEVFFDPRRDITASDIAVMEAIVQQHRMVQSPYKWTGAAYYVRALRRFDPRFEVETAFNLKEKEEMRENIRTWRANARDWWDIIRLINAVQDLDPSFHVQTVIDATDIHMMRQTLRNTLPLDNHEKRNNYALFAAEIQRIDPTFNISQEFSPVEVSNFYKELDHLRGRSGQWVRFTRLARAIMVFDPSFRVTEQIQPADWEKLRKDLRFRREAKDWEGFAQLAEAMDALSQNINPPDAGRPSKPFPIVKTY